ncbi:hypothetical protein CDAR_297541 [Caerostris darwini]|uniref:Uncharacterized protein n=1 Tax=Caerostris darwini TaxID=1538125 RepID=A0AAV4PLX1_9ARAC|nr:hypothetical protein CDAR_297541 [Caerostris darwini]
MFSEELQKWCYPKKDTFWKKPKAMPSKLVEVVESCNWFKACDVCDRYFSEWLKLDDVVANDLAPNTTGIYMIAVLYGKEREVVNIYYGQNDIKVNIKESLENYSKSMDYVLRNKKFVNKSPCFQVRWTEFKEADNDNCCFLYAHWLNTDKPIPLMNYKIPGEEAVEKNKHFVIRTHDKKWCYEVDVLKQSKITKSKQRKHLMNDLESDMRDLSCATNS